MIFLGDTLILIFYMGHDTDLLHGTYTHHSSRVIFLCDTLILIFCMGHDIDLLHGTILTTAAG